MRESWKGMGLRSPKKTRLRGGINPNVKRHGNISFSESMMDKR